MEAMPDFIVAIPARYAATRLPGKPLRLLGGEPLVLHVARRALDAGAREVWVAADDERIAQALDGSGVRIAMTSPDHASGSDRLAECAAGAAYFKVYRQFKMYNDPSLNPYLYGASSAK